VPNLAANGMLKVALKLTEPCDVTSVVQIAIKLVEMKIFNFQLIPKMTPRNQDRQQVQFI